VRRGADAMVCAGLPMRELPNYTAHKDRMLARPAVRRVLEREGVSLA
jgi:glutathione S-transferase